MTLVRSTPGRLLSMAALLVAVTSSRPASASGFDAPTISHGQSSPVSRDAAAVHYNPGQLGFIDRTEPDVGLGLIFGSIGYQRERRGQYQYADNFDFAEPIDPADIDPSRTGLAPAVKATPVGPILDAFVAFPVIADRLTLGAGFYIPYAAILSLPEDGAQRYQAQSVTLISTHTTVSAGVKLHDVISLGAGVSYVLSIMELSKVQDFGAVQSFADGLAASPINQPNSFGPDAPSTVRELDVLSRQARIGPAVSHGVSFNAGVALRPTKKLDLALVYQHGSRMRLKGDFTLDMNDDFFTQDLAAQGLQFPPLVKGQAKLGLSLPKRLTLGAGYQVHPKVKLDGSFSYVFYSDFDVVDIELSSPDLAQPALGIGETVPQDRAQLEEHRARRAQRTRPGHAQAVDLGQRGLPQRGLARLHRRHGLARRPPPARRRGHGVCDPRALQHPGRSQGAGHPAAHGDRLGLRPGQRHLQAVPGRRGRAREDQVRRRQAGQEEGRGGRRGRGEARGRGWRRGRRRRSGARGGRARPQAHVHATACRDG